MSMSSLTVKVETGDVLHIWHKPVVTTQSSSVRVEAVVSSTLNGPPSDDFQRSTYVSAAAGEVVLQWDASQTEISVVYAFNPKSVFMQGIRLLFCRDEAKVRDKRYQFHVSPPFGWMNDPNGLIERNGITHLFYQHYPHAVHWDTMHWGHAISHNLVDWIDLPIFLHPRAELLAEAGKKGGAFSGSAIAGGDGGLTIFHTDREDGRQPEQEWQMLATSADLLEAQPSAPIIQQRPPLPGFGRDLRDPYVFQGPDGLWKMVLGGADETAALVVLYETRDPSAKSGWAFAGVLHREPLERAVPAECPCLIALDGEGQGLYALVFGLIGHKTPVRGRLNPSFALVGSFDGKVFKEIFRRELDFVGDCYALQAFQHQSRPVGIAWAANWANVRPLRRFPSAMTLPRRMVWQAGNLLMPPVESVQALRRAQLASSARELANGVALPDGLAEIEIDFAKAGLFRLELNHPDGALQLVVDGKELELLTAKPKSAAVRHAVETDMPNSLSIYVDIGLIEIYIDGGRLCGTKRIDSDAPISGLQIEAADGLIAEAKVWQLRPALRS